jgi:hypothetical protein
MIRALVGALVLNVVPSIGYTEQLPVGSPLSGYECYHIDVDSLHLTKEDVFSGRGFPPVYAGPSAESKKLGVAPDLVYVAWPLERQIGFVRMLRLGGQLGWISEGAIKPLYHEPSASGGCTLAWRADGTIHSHLDPGTKGWLWPDGHDLPEGK